MIWSGHLTRRRLELAAVAVLSLLFSSCATVEFQSVYFRDGSAEHTLLVTIPREELEAVPVDPYETFDEIAASAVAAGLEARRVDSPDSVSFQIRDTSSEGDEAGAALNSLLNATGINQSPGISAPFQGSFKQETAAVGGSTFVLDLDIDGALLYDAIAAMDAASGVPRDELESEIGISYQATVPGDLHSTTGTRVADDTLRWDVSPNGVTHAQAETSAGGAGTAFLFIAAAIAAVAAAIALAVIIGWVLVRRPRLSSAIAAAATHFPRRTTITGEGLWVARHVRHYVVRIWRRSATTGLPPIRDDLLQAEALEQEEDEDGADAEGNRPAPGLHSR